MLLHLVHLLHQLHLPHLLHLLQLLQILHKQPLLHHQPHLWKVGDHLALKAQRKDSNAFEKLLRQGGAVNEVVEEADLVQHQPRQVLGVSHKGKPYITIDQPVDPPANERAPV